MRSNKEKMWDNLMNWDTEFQVQIESMENMENMDASPPGASAQNLVGNVDSMSFMDRHAFAVSNTTRSMDASMTPPTSTIKLFTNAQPFPPTRTPRGSLHLVITCTNQSVRNQQSHLSTDICL
jgi:hypothetical protein